MNEEIANKIMQLKIKMLHFAWDNMKDSEIITKKLGNLSKLQTLKPEKQEFI